MSPTTEVSNTILLTQWVNELDYLAIIINIDFEIHRNAKNQRFEHESAAARAFRINIIVTHAHHTDSAKGKAMQNFHPTRYKLSKDEVKVYEWFSVPVISLIQLQFQLIVSYFTYMLYFAMIPQMNMKITGRDQKNNNQEVST